MADKKFGVKQINLIGASGTPTLTSPNNLNINAANVAISTDISVGGRIVGTSTSNVTLFFIILTPIYLLQAHIMVLLLMCMSRVKHFMHIAVLGLR